VSSAAPRQGAKRYRLVLARVCELDVGRRDLVELAKRVTLLAPEIEVVIAGKRTSGQWHLLPYALRPTLTIGFGELQRRRLLPGRILHCPVIAKDAELERLRGAGIPVPDWVAIEPETRLDPGVWGPYVVVKPTFGGMGVDVRIRRTGRVRWSAPELQPHGSPMLAQRFVYTGPWAASYRVCTFFGRALYGWRVEQSHAKRRLEGRWKFGDAEGGGGIQIIAPSRTSAYTLCGDEDVLELAERAHRLAFPDYPYLGIDLVRDAETGELQVIEANSGGQVWHLSSKMGISMQRVQAIDLYRQFDALGRAAERLVEVTRRLALAAPFGRPQLPIEVRPERPRALTRLSSSPPLP
jgi:hypothetical protein